VPGSLTNQPPAGGVALPPGAGNVNSAASTPVKNGSANAGATGASTTQPAGGATDSTSRQTTRNYEIDRTLDYTRQPAGKLKRLTVAVLIDNPRTVGKDGKSKEVPLTPQQLEHVNQLVKDAVGFDEARGDSVNVVNASFTEEAPAPAGELETPPFWEAPLFRDLAKIVAGALVLLALVLSVLRPLVRSLIAPSRGPVTLTRTTEAALAAGTPPAVPAAQKDAVAAVVNHEQQVAQARTLVNQDPKRVAQLVRGWVAQDE
jgi:flagellar M-ring protein FliF